jgi:hypothetical protein
VIALYVYLFVSNKRPWPWAQDLLKQKLKIEIKDLTGTAQVHAISEQDCWCVKVSLANCQPSKQPV